MLQFIKHIKGQHKKRGSYVKLAAGGGVASTYEELKASVESVGNEKDYVVFMEAISDSN